MDEQELDEFYDTSIAEMSPEPPAREGLQRNLRIAAGVLVTTALLGWIGQMMFGGAGGSDEADAPLDLPGVSDVSLTEPQALQLVPAPTALVGGDAATAPSPSPENPPSPPPVTPVVPASARWYVVQVASFAGPERADTLVAELTGLSLPAYRVTLKVADGGPLYVVLLGRYNSAAEAESAAARVRVIPGYADAKIQALAPRPSAQN
jgi:septal ring-binding cell division protein DamX